MKDINYREEDWQEAKSALAPFAAANWFGGLFNNLEDVSKNMEVAEEDILDLDSDRAISFQHKNYQDKYGEIEDDLKVLHKFSSHAGERIETLIDEPFYKKLDAFVDGMQDLSITTYSTTNRIGAKSTQTYTTSDGTSQVIESVKENATIEDLMNGDNFYANQMNLQYEAWKRANPDQDVSEADFKMGMLHTRAFDYKSIKDKQEEKEFWVNIVATVVMVGVSIVCPPAGLALGIGYGALEASSAITGKDWISGRELSNQERLLRGGFALLDIIPGVKAFSSGAKIASTGSKMLRVGDDLLGGGKLAIKNAGKEFQGTIDNGIQAGKRALDVRIPNVKKVTDDVMQAAKEKLTRDLNDIGTAAKTIQSKAKETFQMPPRERLAFAGVGDDIAGQTATGTISAAQKKLRDMMSKMDDLNIKGSGTGDIIEKASGAVDDITIPSVRNNEFNKWFDNLTSKQLDEVWKNPEIRKKIEDRIRRPGGYHEWHLVSRTPTFKKWGVSMDDIKELRTLTKDVEFVNPSGWHGGRGSTKAHNEILKIIDNATDYDNFVVELNEWASRRLKNGVNGLPERLRR
ncbi:pre-toxin TG domain-containing protein [Listeria seeligeri]|uniref:pre-toxin TG domain-containing protein n=1 Tax=Listeria seeligeri TaxID=1640 RepID=UPI00162688A2|nr:pre-toxin TG domain-containing protein [Listeria seeligeri]MBC1823689.1 ribonuclease YeeF family protein [Listeria seeligeri]MBC1837463.1 ribonuclease YeeF family protein [Listeria seeligeri]MBF2359716.1 ribonuclease YeeF family protein [Listeria seeligeri]MBF2497158.1 ribonuclease YeeF family protein [Listeria seeligeri]MBF2541255.1 ribonuclease YeeF family protein [Listeria seeligeri]